jgi:hypothetical protein
MSAVSDERVRWAAEWASVERYRLEVATGMPAGAQREAVTRSADTSLQSLLNERAGCATKSPGHQKEGQRRQPQYKVPLC